MGGCGVREDRSIAVSISGPFLTGSKLFKEREIQKTTFEPHDDQAVLSGNTTTRIY